MRYGAAVLDGVRRTVVILGDQAAALPLGAPTPDDAVRDAAALEAIRAGVEDAERVPLAGLDLRAPLARFNRDVLCTGWNYWEHFEESKGKREGQDPKERPTHPTFFTKGPDTVIGPNDDIAFDPEISTKWDYEAEVAIVIGKTGRSIPEDKALDYVGGYLIANDVSQRDLQRAHGGQWLKGKSIDATMPLGPWITTPDEIADPHDLAITFDLNGVRLQDATTKLTAFSFAQVIAELSWGMTLRAGDVVLTGTPHGIGNAREPQIFLKEGDELVTRVEGLGELRNRMVRTRLA
ncbi:2-keto-4-pentenoate hydratase/2-oxohepta-3-ene-1,7-dioic acid hydratase in catechol pathway [Actinocorallia herbida]|uniref:2-keto-4-pentenoate hydratase/2-oxohepta-3-ene-1,7-dioic acid hydratase in catechol pathway n=1 Tax=Actinocorallia herbida TaxID=58109 RepID=A0A3N1CP15_9ACTN|nr:fumarylacetoacetate hydrolase family protein [Actinocorallia herbida]ROO83067.1 2-keto-4-pentenoate hydratase/2-oxohepta-3-ene-1,7-dioic acid hydratase in catechol pathway [Actinocorallia herbida]